MTPDDSSAADGTPKGHVYGACELCGEPVCGPDDSPIARIQHDPHACILLLKDRLESARKECSEWKQRAEERGERIKELEEVQTELLDRSNNIGNLFNKEFERAEAAERRIADIQKAEMPTYNPHAPDCPRYSNDKGECSCDGQDWIEYVEALSTYALRVTAEAQADKARMDWLTKNYVSVSGFFAGSGPGDIRAKIDAAMAKQPIDS